MIGQQNYNHDIIPLCPNIRKNSQRNRLQKSEMWGFRRKHLPQKIRLMNLFISRVLPDLKKITQLKSTYSPKRPYARLLLFTNDSIVQSRNVIGSIFTLAWKSYPVKLETSFCISWTLNKPATRKTRDANNFVHAKKNYLPELRNFLQVGATVNLGVFKIDQTR